MLFSTLASRPLLRPILFALFFCSGFSSLIYQVVWLRLAFAHFGILTPVVSVVVSVFMLGIGAGSLLAGRFGPALARRTGLAPASLYGLTELIIGLGAVTVPMLFAFGESVLLRAGAAGSAPYLALSAIVITLAMLPWCTMMGATLPLMMAYARASGAIGSRSFSFLYAANVLGATAGTVASAAVFIELFGFTRTSLIAATINIAIAVVSFLLPRSPGADAPAATAIESEAASASAGRRAGWILLVLFTTGFCSLGMEVLWTRAFTIILWTTIYAFAIILATYLFATWIGSALYRLSLRRGGGLAEHRLLLLIAAASFLPVVLDDPRLHRSVTGVLLSLAPICALLGYLTPMLMDEYAGGDPRRAGRGYAVNILGGILGPLIAGYLIAPMLDIRIGLAVFALPLVSLAAAAAWRAPTRTATLAFGLAPVLALMLFGFVVSRSYEDLVHNDEPRVVHRDYVATAIAHGTGMSKGLLVNGIGITTLTPITKMMAHLPAAVHGHAKDALVICFGMGTTMRSMASWGIDTTAVDLTGAVIDSFPFFFADAARVSTRPNVHIVVDDGRRFLLRTDRMFDIVVLDPPPPVEAAGSSLLYSTEFYDAVKRRLRPDGIVQQWMPGEAEPHISQAIARSLADSFPYVLAFRGQDGYGQHFLASMQPIPDLDPATLAARMPPAARDDLVEWDPTDAPASVFAGLRARQTAFATLLPAANTVPAITDDRPYNEYFLLRRRIMTGAM